MKKYEPEALVAVSRYQNWFPTLPKDVQRDVYARMRELLEEEKAYCDEGNYAHMAQMDSHIDLPLFINTVCLSTDQTSPAILSYSFFSLLLHVEQSAYPGRQRRRCGEDHQQLQQLAFQVVPVFSAVVHG